MIAPVENAKIEGISESAAIIESKAYLENSTEGRLRSESDRNNCCLHGDIQCAQGVRYSRLLRRHR